MCCMSIHRLSVGVLPVPEGLKNQTRLFLGIVTRQTKVDDFDFQWLPNMIHHHDVLRLQVGVKDPEALQELQGYSQLKS